MHRQFGLVLKLSGTPRAWGPSRWQRAAGLTRNELGPLAGRLEARVNGLVTGTGGPKLGLERPRGQAASTRKSPACRGRPATSFKLRRGIPSPRSLRPGPAGPLASIKFANDVPERWRVKSGLPRDFGATTKLGACQGDLEEQNNAPLIMSSPARYNAARSLLSRYGSPAATEIVSAPSPRDRARET